MLLAVVTSLCTLLPAPVAAQDAPAVRTEFVEMVLAYCDGRFDPKRTDDAGVETGTDLMLDSADRPTVAQGSLEYAAALLTAGADDARAVAIINNVLDSEKGGFPWVAGADPTPEASTHVAPWLTYIHAELADKLPANVAQGVSAALPATLESVARLKAKPSETSRFLMKVAALATLEAELGNDGRAEAEFAKWTAHTQAQGIAQLHSSGRMVIATAALNWVWRAGLSDAMKADAAAALDYIYRDMALRLSSATGCLGGAAVAADSLDYSAAMGASRYLLYALFGSPSVESVPPFALFLALPGYLPSDETRAIASSPGAGRTTTDRAGDARFTTYVGPSHSLGTMSGAVEWNTAPVVATYPPFEASWDEATDDGETVARTAELTRNLICDIRPAPSRVTSLQIGPKAIVSFDFDEIGEAESRRDVYVDIKLGPEAAIGSVYLNTSPYTAAFGADVSSKSAVVTERSGVYTAVTVMTLGPAVPKTLIDPTSYAGILGWVPSGDRALGPDLVLRLPARTNLGAQPDRDNYRISFAIEMGDAATYGSVDEFVKYIYSSRIRKNLKTSRTKIGTTDDDKPHRVPGIRRPTERSKWIYDEAVVQELQYESGADVLVLHEDLKKNEVLVRAANGIEQVWDALYQSDSLNHMAGDLLGSTLRPPPAAPAPPADEPAQE